MIPSSSALRRSYNYYDDPNPNFRPQEDPPSFSLDHFPSPFLDHHHDHNQLLFFTHDNINSPQPQQLMAHDEHIHGGAYINIPADKNSQDITMNTTHDDHPTPSSEVIAPKMIKKSSSNKGAAKKQRTKSGKTDRHSKICTAQGIRDRRMRLSLQIARKFFDLQDMLGFDKASKTIDWLFSKSKKAIKNLSCTTTNHLPQINMISTNKAYHNNATGSEKSDSSMSPECEVESEGDSVSGERKARKSQTAAYGNNSINARDTRNKARARARERTRKKMMIRFLEKSPHYYLSDQTSTSTYNLAKSGSSAAANPNSIFETVQESSVSSYTTTQERTNSSHEYSSSHASHHHHHQIANVGIVASSSAAPAGPSCSIFDYQENDALFSGGLDSYSNKFLSFLGNWNISSNNSAMTTNIYVPNIDRKK